MKHNQCSKWVFKNQTNKLKFNRQYFFCTLNPFKELLYIVFVGISQRFRQSRKDGA